MLQVFLGLGAEISEMNYEGIGILHYAVIRNNKDLMKFLLDAGADATYKDPSENTPADWASALGYGKIAKLLFIPPVCYVSEFQKYKINNK